MRFYPTNVHGIVGAEHFQHLSRAKKKIGQSVENAFMGWQLRALRKVRRSKCAVRRSVFIVYCDERRFEEAERELATAVEVFDEHSDSRETAKCRLLQGMSAHRRGSLREACSLYDKAVDAAGRSGDLATLASASNNLGHAKADLGEHAAAVEALQQALAVFSELGMTGEMLRARCVLGRVLLAQARYSQAREMFLEARAGFRELGMTEECGISGLDLADALVGLEEHVHARMVIEDVISDFRRANLSERTDGGRVPAGNGRHAVEPRRNPACPRILQAAA